MNDLRILIGSFFSLIGVLLLVVGMIGPSVRPPQTTANIDVYCGLSMLVFGSVMLWLARRSF
jgi:uncharacterized membrane protein